MKGLTNVRLFGQRLPVLRMLKQLLCQINANWSTRHYQLTARHW